MVRSLQGGILGLACLAALGGSPLARGDDPPAPKPPAADKPADAAARAKAFALPGEDPLEPFVPLKPRTVEDREQIEALSKFAAARALESRRSLGEAIALYEEALKESPDSVAVLRRLSKLNLALGRTEPAIRYSRQVLAQEPSDTETITRLVNYYANRRNNPAEAESILKEVLANPKLDPKSGGRIVAEFELGRLYAQKLGKAKEAAESFAKVVEALDDREANRLSPADLRRVLGGDEAEAYRNFGQVFLEAGKLDLAVKAFEHGMDYDPDDITLPLLLGQTLLKTGDNARALILLEEHIKRQPQGTEGYESLAQALKALGREAELTPRLEAAAKRDPHNLALQFVLVERYRAAGDGEKADALEKKIREARPTPQGYAALAASFLKRKKAEDFLKTIADAVRAPGGLEAVQESLRAATQDGAFVDQVLDAGLTLLKADPPALKPVGVPILALLATQSGKLEKLLPIQVLETKRNPSPQSYKELLDLLVNLRKNREAAETLSEMIQKFEAEKTARNLVNLVRLYRMSDQPEAAQRAAREALKGAKLDAKQIAAIGITNQR
ncbi:MAG: tetratricopeptide repeat protein, partial [Thermoleophilia bacterium]|nr:tetratricopeptide repeat protein [Thermoleophilia bacterium]